MKKNIFFILGLLFTIYFLLSSAFAEVPHLINYQGKLTDKAGAPLEGSYSITLRIYDALASGTLLWEETQDVLIQKGVFHTMLGATVNLDLPFDIPYYLEIKVADEVMTPRQRIASAGYAIRAKDVDILPRGSIILWYGSIASIPSGWALCDGSNGTPDLRDRFVIGATQDSGGVAKTNITGSLLQLGGNTSHNHGGATGGQIGMQGKDFDHGQVYILHSGHTHSISSDEHIPPFYALAYIMKL